MTLSQRIDEDVKQRLRASRKARKSFMKSPQAARKWLIEMGILENLESGWPKGIADRALSALFRLALLCARLSRMRYIRGQKSHR